MDLNNTENRVILTMFIMLILGLLLYLVYDNDEQIKYLRKENRELQSKVSNQYFSMKFAQRQRDSANSMLGEDCFDVKEEMIKLSEEIELEKLINKAMVYKYSDQDFKKRWGGRSFERSKLLMKKYPDLPLNYTWITALEK